MAEISKAMKKDMREFNKSKYDYALWPKHELVAHAERQERIINKANEVLKLSEGVIDLQRAQIKFHEFIALAGFIFGVLWLAFDIF